MCLIPRGARIGLGFDFPAQNQGRIAFIKKMGKAVHLAFPNKLSDLLS